MFFSTTTSFDFVKNWKYEVRDIYRVSIKSPCFFTIVAPIFTHYSDQRINELKATKMTKGYSQKYKNFSIDTEYEIILPPGTLSVIKKEYCSDIKRDIIFCDFTPMSKEDCMTYLDTMPVQVVNN